MKFGAPTTQIAEEDDVFDAEEESDLINARRLKVFDNSSQFAFRKHSRTIRTCIGLVGLCVLFYMAVSLHRLLVQTHTFTARLEQHLQSERKRDNETTDQFGKLSHVAADTQRKIERLMDSQKTSEQDTKSRDVVNSRLATLLKNLQHLETASPEPDKIVQQQIKEVAQHIMSIEKLLPALEGKSDQMKESMGTLQDQMAYLRKSLLESQKSTQFHVNYGASISLNVAMVQICGIEKIIEALKSRDAWFQGILNKLNTRGPDESPYDFFAPVYSLCPDGKLNTFGDGMGEREGCDLQRLGEISGKCKIISIGSDGSWSFEKAVFEATKCEVHTFDCNMDLHPPPELSSRVFAYHTCLGIGDSSVSLPQDHLPFHVILSMTGADRELMYLKLNTNDGFEWNILPHILSVPANLPDQISLKLHYRNTSEGQILQKSPAEITIFGEMMFRAGYLLLSRRYHMLHSAESMEYLLARIAK